MTPIPARAPHTEGIRAALTATGRPVGLGVKPADGGWRGQRNASDFAAYHVIHSIPGGTLDGPISAPNDDADWLWQINTVGNTEEQCTWASDLARRALLALPITVAGRAVCEITLDTTVGVMRDDTVQPPVFICTERYRLLTTP